MKNPYPRVARLRTAGDFESHVESLDIHLPFDRTLVPGDEGPLGQTLTLQSGRIIGNRFAVLPMEGWDGTHDGKPTDKVLRRWKNFGRSGGKLIWGGEAAAVRPDGRANPKQLMINAETMPGLGALRSALLQEHASLYG